MRLEFAHVEDVPPSAWRWPHVHPAREWACQGTGRIVVAPDFLDRFERLRQRFGKPLPITSGYRSPEHNARVSSTGRSGPHTTARAVDIAVAGADAITLVYLAVEEGFSGIGVKQHGPHGGRFIHLDTLTSQEGYPRPWLWSYR